jgi:hypothetical protein
MGKIVAFSIASGLLWSIFPAAAYAVAPGGAVLAVLAAIVTAFFTSLVVLRTHRRIGGGAWRLGPLSLPVGMFLFGVCNDCLQGFALAVSGGNYGFLDGFHPLRSGLVYAILSFVPPWVLLFLPASVFTTKLLLMLDGHDPRRPLPAKLPEFVAPESSPS